MSSPAEGCQAARRPQRCHPTLPEPGRRGVWALLTERASRPTAAEQSRDSSAVAFDAFYVENHMIMLRYAQSVLRADGGLAEELVHDAFITMLRQWDKVMSTVNPRAYAFAILRNQIRDHHRRSHPTSTLDAVPSGEPSGDGGIGEAEASVVLRDLLNRLPERQREVLLLRYVVDLTNREIAELLGLSERTVSVHIHRARTALRAAGTV
ncbi:RNA polymerase sigma factor [Streptomyces chartreusis]|uniref:RNA polymerase sigma factor n=1 Tax=Streptomyces chartreusis TaxID=1969 RepID=UPI00227D79DD|nr:sigma-70 family RNA polymerase sigma factor [Streptomyces chartreusis]